MGLLDWLRQPKAVSDVNISVSNNGSSVQVDEPVSGLERQVTALIQENNSLQEQLWSGGAVGYDPDAALSSTGGGSLYFNRLSGASVRDMLPAQRERALDLAYFLYEANPLGRAIVGITRDFVLGDSVGAGSVEVDESRREEQQEVINCFWSDDINLMNIKLQTKVLELGLYGEQCYPVTVNPVDGHCQLGYIDPASIHAVFHDPRNPERPLAVILLLKNPTTNQQSEVWYRIIQPEDDPTSEWFGRLMGSPAKRTDLPADAPTTAIQGLTDAATKETSLTKTEISWRDRSGVAHTHPVEGSVFYFKVNAVSNATRGRSDLQPLIDWIDAYDQVLFNEVDRELLMKSFVWDVSLEGYNDTQIDEYKKKNPQPKPGAVRYHNEKVVWTAVSPELKSADATIGADLLMSYIATGARMPKTWLNGTMDVNKATAQELGAPALANLGQRQQYVKYIIHYMLRFVLDQAEMRGTIKRRVAQAGAVYSARPKEWSLQINLPDLKQVNQISIAASLANIVSAAEAAVNAGFIDTDLAQEMVVMFIKEMGIEVNITALRERLEANPPPPAIGGLPGMPPYDPAGINKLRQIQTDPTAQMDGQRSDGTSNGKVAPRKTSSQFDVSNITTQIRPSGLSKINKRGSTAATHD